MKKVSLLALAVASLGLSQAQNLNVNVQLSGDYVKFNNENTQEYKSRYDFKLKSNIEYQGWIFQVGDVYQKWNLADWEKQIGGKDFSVNIPYIRINKKIGDKILGIGFIYVKSDWEKLTSDGAWGVNLNFSANLYRNGNKLIRYGVFYQYTAIRNGDVSASADITQFTPNLLIAIDRIYIKPYVNLQNISSDWVNTFKVSGGVNIYAKLNQTFGITAGVKYGRSVYLSDGTEMDTIARYNRFKANLGVDIQPIKRLHIEPKIIYEGWETVDKLDITTNPYNPFSLQKALGVGLNISYSF